WSPITGPAGNIEYLLWLGMEREIIPPTLAAIQEITKQVMQEFGKK
ncbi:MAG: TlyA family rRNA (cytidine-2'-O)-methyltransferase, partial [Aphanizomenon sp.]